MTCLCLLSNIRCSVGEDLYTLGLVIEEAVNLGDGSVEDNDREAMVSSV